MAEKALTAENIKKKALQLVGGLVMEKKDGQWVVSVGRVSWWLAFAPALYIWVSGGGILEGGVSLTDISPNHLTVLLTLAGYNFGKKVADLVGTFWGKSTEQEGPG